MTPPVPLRPANDVRRCTIKGCGGKHCGRGYCKLHYRRWYKWGDTNLRGIKGPNNPSFRHGMNESPFWLSWRSMKGRCTNQNDRAFNDYGGRGIKVCERWMTFENFRDDMLPTYFKGATIERIDVNGNYEPTNCKWVTKEEQSHNKRSTRWITFDGKTQDVAKWSKETGIKYSVLYHRLVKLKEPPEIVLSSNSSLLPS